MVLILLLLNVIELVFLIVLLKGGKIVVVKNEHVYVPAPRRKKAISRRTEPEYDEEEE